jgi:hypothetical protein
VLLVETGFEFDRAWMLVDADGEFVTQRDLPRLALIRCELRHSELVLRAPGMLALHSAARHVEAPTRVRVWNDEVAAYDMGALAARWCSDFLRQELRLVRFDPDQRRLSARAWTGPLEAGERVQRRLPGARAVERLARRAQRAPRRARRGAVTMARFPAQPGARRPRRARRGPPRRAGLRHARGPGAAAAGETLPALPESPTSTPTPACRASEPLDTPHRLPRRPARRRRHRLRHETR